MKYWYLFDGSSWNVITQLLILQTTCQRTHRDQGKRYQVIGFETSITTPNFVSNVVPKEGILRDNPLPMGFHRGDVESVLGHRVETVLKTS